MIVRMMDRFHSKAYYNLSATKEKKRVKNNTTSFFFMFRFGLVGLFAANSSIIVLIGSVEDTGQPLLEDNQISGGSIITLYYTKLSGRIFDLDKARDVVVLFWKSDQTNHIGI